MGIKVAKFGGTSVADAIQLEKVKNIVLSDPERRYVVVSAPGKRYQEDNKVTDLLYLVKTHIEHNVPYDQVFQVIADRFTSIAANLRVDVHKIMEELDQIKTNLKDNVTADYIASRGEYLTAMIMAEYLGFDFVDTAGLVLFDKKGRYLDEETNKVLSEELAKHEHAVIPGFYGTTPDGAIKTFSRGGSDITGSLVARAVNASMYENWTDVSGFMMADPRIIKNPKPIKTITYKELRELSYMGASVLHEDAVFPVRAADIPINIRNTNEPDHEGTIILAQAPVEPGSIITGVAGRKDFTVIAIYKNMMNAEVGFVKKVLSVLEDYNISFEHLPSGIDTLSVIIHSKRLENIREELLEDIRRRTQPDTMEVYDDMALIATVGNGMARTPGVSATLFAALYHAGVNVRMIDQGSSEMNIIVGVENSNFAAAIKAIYSAFVEDAVTV